MSSEAPAQKGHYFAFNSDCEKCAAHGTFFDDVGVTQWLGENRYQVGREGDNFLIEKIATTPYNEVSRLTSNTDGFAIMKMAPRVYEYSARQDACAMSETATMQFGLEGLKLPFPELILWGTHGGYATEGSYKEESELIATDGHSEIYSDNDSDGNPVPWRTCIFMKESEGTQLSKICHDLDLKSKAKMVSEIMVFEKKLASLWFQWHGSLYRESYDERLKDKPYKQLAEKMQPMQATSEAHDEALKYTDRYSKWTRKLNIGPSQEFRLWEGEREHMVDHHGPWASATDYVTALLGCEIDWAKNAGEKQDEAGQGTKKLQFAPQVYVELLQKASSIVPHIMPRKERTTASRLLHRCLRPEDIFVDEEFRIKTVIGWRGSWAGPAFAGHAPTAYEIGGHDMLNHPKEFLAQLKSEVSEEEFDRFSQQLLARSREHKELTDSPISSLIHVAIKIEEFGLLPLREFLIQVQRTWGHFDTQGADSEDPCPYQFTDDEMREHAEEVEGSKKGENEEVKQACLQAKRWVAPMEERYSRRFRPRSGSEDY